METETQPALELRAFTADLYPEFARFIGAHGGFVPEIDELPCVGYVAVDPGGPVAFCFAKLDPGSSIAGLDYLVSRPGLTAPEARWALQFVVGAVEEFCRANGRKRVISCVPPALAREAERLGYGTSKDELRIIVKDL